MSFLRAAVRFAAVVLATAGCFAIWWVGRCFVGQRSPRGLLWRRRWMRRWSRTVVRILGIHVETAGPLPPAPCVLLSNHCGYVDIPVFAACLELKFVSKREVRSWPLIGAAAAAIGTIFLDRESRRAIPEVNAQIASALGAGERVLFFPEGTSTDGDALLPFRSSLLEPASSSGYPVFCAAVRYSTPAGEPPASRVVCWWGDMDFTGHFVRLLRLSRFRAQVVFHPEPIAGADRKELAAATERVVAGLLARLKSS